MKKTLIVMLSLAVSTNLFASDAMRIPTDAELELGKKLICFQEENGEFREVSEGSSFERNASGQLIMNKRIYTSHGVMVRPQVLTISADQLSYIHQESYELINPGMSFRHWDDIEEESSTEQSSIVSYSEKKVYIDTQINNLIIEHTSWSSSSPQDKTVYKAICLSQENFRNGLLGK